MRNILTSILKCKYIVPIVAFIVVAVGLYLTTKFEPKNKNTEITEEIVIVNYGDTVVIESGEQEDTYFNNTVGDNVIRTTDKTQIIIETVLKDGTINEKVDSGAKYHNASKSQIEDRIKATVDEINTISDGRLLEFSEDKVVIQILMTGVDEFPDTNVEMPTDDESQKSIKYIVKKNAADCLSIYYGDGQTLAEQTDKSIYDIDENTQEELCSDGVEFNSLESAIQWIESL